MDAGFSRPKHPHVNWVEIGLGAIVRYCPADDQYLRELRQALEDGIADPTADRVEEEVYALRACPEGVHLFFDTVGGWIGDAVFESLAKFAKVLIVGRTISNNSTQPNLDPVNMRMLWAREASIQCFSRYSYPDKWAFARERMMSLCRNNKITTIDNIIDGFEQTPNALHDMLAGKYTGKVMVRYAEAEE